MLSTPTPAEVTAMGAVLPAIDIIVVALRLYAKRKIRRYGIDDWLVVVSLVFLVLMRVERLCSDCSQILTIGMGFILIYGMLAIISGFPNRRGAETKGPQAP